MKSWTEKLSKCLADIVQDMGTFSEKPYIEMSKNDINEYVCRDANPRESLCKTLFMK